MSLLQTKVRDLKTYYASSYTKFMVWCIRYKIIGEGREGLIDGPKINAYKTFLPNDFFFVFRGQGTTYLALVKCAKP